MLKASWGGGGRGMRVVDERVRARRRMVATARREAKAAFGNDEVYLEKLVRARAAHRSAAAGRLRTATSCTCSSATARCSGAIRRSSSARRRRSSTTQQRRELCEQALKIGRAVQYLNAGTVEFLQDADTGKFYFIEVNPRVQVEHTVTEAVTGIDIVRAQIRIAEGAAIGTPESGVPRQEDIRLNGYAMQCRVTTEDPENNFIPDYGRITAYRSPAGFGIRLDAGTAYSGAIITPSYDSLLVKVTAWAPTPQDTIARMHRALWEFRVRGVATNLRFLDQLIMHPRFAHGGLHDQVHRRDAGAVPLPAQARPRDAAAELHRRRDRQRQRRSEGPAAPDAAGESEAAEARAAAARARHEAEARRARRRALRRVDAASRSACC